MSDDDNIIFNTQGQDEPEPEPVDESGGAADPSMMTPLDPEPGGPWNPATPRSDDIAGPGEAWAGQVVHVYDSADGQYGQPGTLDVKRITPFTAGSPDYALSMDESAPARSAPEPAIYKAVALPRPDQPLYRFSKDDPVLIVAGRDGRLYAIPDDVPFIGEVVATTRDTDAKESNFGGAGHAAINVRRVLVYGDPSLDGGVSFHMTETHIYYNWAKVLVHDSQHPGHRVGSFVLCFRKGGYVFALPDRGVYHGVTVAKGPDDEEDKTGQFHWVSIKQWGVTYPVGSERNYWSWTSAKDQELFRVCAANLASSTHLPAGTQVVVTLFAGSSVDSGERSGYWVFSYLDSSTVTKDSVCVNATYSPQYPAGQTGPPAWSAISATPLVGDPTNSAHKFIKGQMYLDGDGKYNPWFVLGAAYATASDFCASTSYYPNGWTAITGKTALNADYNKTPNDGSTTSFITGYMGLDAAGKLNPWFFFNPSTAVTPYLQDHPEDVFCIEAEPSTNLVTVAGFNVLGHMHVEGTGSAKRINPHFSLSIIGDGSSGSPWINVALVDGSIKLTHGTPGPEVYGFTDACALRGGSLDAKGHVRWIRYFNGSANITIGPLSP